MQGKVTMNLSDVVTLAEAKADLKITNNDLKLQINELKLEVRQLKELDEQTRPIKVITRNMRDDRWGGSEINTNVEYVNLDSVKKEIKDVCEQENEKELVKIKPLKAQVASLTQDIDLKGDEFDAFTVTETKRFKIKADNLETSFKEKTNRKDQELKDLQEELQKERDNKTDKELEEKRNKEITALKKRIKTLEEEVKLLASLGFIKRTWRKLTNHIALKSAKKELEIERKAVNEIPTNHGFYTRATNSLFKFIDLNS